MAAILGRYTTILVDEWNFSGQSNGMNLNTTNDRLDVTPFETAGSTFIQGDIGATMEHAGFFMGDGAGYLEKEIHDRLGAGQSYVGIFLGTATAACPVYVLPNTEAQRLQITAPVKNVITVSGTWGAGTGLKRGLRVFNGTIDATGAEAGVDFAAAGSAGGWAYLWVSAITGTATNATIDVESDSDPGFGTAVSEGTFTFSAVGGYEIALSGAIGRYIRINTTDLGGATDFAVYAAVAVTGVTL